ncbi:Bridging integrator 3-like [Plakobranchus ocellatus]|uniref:Bridging integrator 3-like n=1 Tax=Plakobranchus ocellatus TaxID=259542 RepID=A0AAV4C3S7_9GAST|nr:Bridging integrator 3-like [Plakobranchus ocellatus]
MSWNPFSRSSSSAPKKTVLSRATQREFEKEVKRLDELEELTRRLYKDGKRLTEANNAVAKSERKLSQELLSTALYQMEEKLKWQIDEWDASMTKMEMHMIDRNVKLHRTVLEPLKKYVSIFPYAQVAVKKRDQCLQEFQKCQDKVSKYQERDRTGQNTVKLEMAKKALNTAQTDFTTQNDALMTDIPKMIDSRTDYFQPSLEAHIKSEVKFTTEAVKVYGELSNLMNGHKQQSRHDYASLIQQALTELKALSITTD